MKINNAAANVPLAGPEATESRETAHTAKAPTAQARESTLNQAIDQAVHLFDHVISAMKGSDSGAASKDIQNAKDAMGDKAKELQSDDKLGNFEIQSLMSDYNETQKTISNIVKKEQDTSNGITQNLK